jgi:hypothetical protein
MIISTATEKEMVSASSTWQQTSDSDFNDGIFNNIKITGSGAAAELTLDESGVSTWTDKTPPSPPANYPGLRDAHSMSQIAGTDKILFYGGWYSGRHNDTWVYDLSDDTWTEQHPANDPANRDSHTIASVSTDDKVVLFGGNTAGYQNDTWIYDYSDKTWTDKTPSNPTPTNNPSKREDHTMASIYGTDKVVIFGGRWSPSYLNDIWAYDAGADTWTNLNPSGPRPTPRTESVMACISGTDKVVLFGGNGTNETWVYDYGDNKWTQMVSFPGSLSRTRMATIYGTDCVLVYGGDDISGFTNNTWIFDLNGGASGSWKQLSCTNPPPARVNHAMSGINGTNQVVLFGGRVLTSPFYNNETWIYNFKIDTKNGSYISMPMDTGSNSSFNSISWDSATPGDSLIRFQLRSGANQSDLGSQPFVGSDGSTSTYYATSPSGLWAGHYGDRWVQYKAILNKSSAASSPVLRDITIEYNCLPTTKVIGPINGSLIAIDKPTFEWQFSDADSTSQQAFQVLVDDEITFESVTYDSGEQTSSTESWQFGSGKSYSSLLDGNWYWKVHTMDIDGEWTEYSEPWKLTVDTLSPNSTLTFPINNEYYNSLSNITGTSVDTETGSGVVKTDISIKHLTDDYYWNGLVWSSGVNWLTANGTSQWIYNLSLIVWHSGASYFIQSRATDLAGHVEQPSGGNYFNMDLTPPSSLIIIPPDKQWVNNLIFITGSSLDTGGSGLDKVEVCLQRVSDGLNWSGTDWHYDEYWLIASGTDQWSYNVSEVEWTTSEQYIIRSRATDQINNIEQPDAGITFRYDALPPWNLLINTNNGMEFTTLDNVYLSLYAEDIGSGVAQMSFSNDGTVWTNWEIYNNSKIYKLSEGDGVKTVYFRVSDYAGNIGEITFDSITLDTIPPEELYLKINNDAKYTKSTEVVLNLNAIDSLSGLNEMTLSFDGITWQPWEPFTDSKAISLPTGTSDGDVRVYFKVSDKAGNIAGLAFDTIILDRIAPQSLSLIIDDGASEVNTPEVTLEISAVDSLSGVESMSFSTDGITWSDWELFSYDRSFVLPPIDGSKTVYFRAMDRAGNIAEPVSTTISLKTVTDTPEDPEADPDKKNAPESEKSYYWIIIPIVIIIIISIIFGFFYRKKQKELDEREVLSGALTIKPGLLALPGSERLEIPNASTPSPPISSEIHSPVPLVPPSTAGAESPQLASQTPAVAQVGAPEPVPQVASIPQHPQLPPAQITDPEPTVTQESVQPSTITPPFTSEDQTQQSILNGTSTPSQSPAPTTAPEPGVTATVNIPTPPLIGPEPDTDSNPTIHLPDSPTTTTKTLSTEPDTE